MSQNIESSATTLSYRLGLLSDVGRQRSLNEDAGEILDLPGAAAAFVVCDGMGGLQAGDKASNEAVKTVRESLADAFREGVPANVPEALRTALQRANDAVNALHQPPPASRGDAEAQTARSKSSGLSNALMGTTCVAGVVIGDTVHIAHAGDSRAYLWRGGALVRLTDDHSYVAERVKAGDITEAEARVSRFRNVVTRAIGIDASVEPDLRTETLLAGDTLLVCSDGLTTMLEDTEIVPILKAQQRASPDRLASVLVEAANKKGGSDNTTVMILRADSGDTAASDGANTSGVLDLDAPSPRSKGSSALVTTLVVLLIVALCLAGFFYYRFVQAKSTSETTPSGVASSPLSIDYARLVYDPPQPFSNLGARGDLLSFSRDGGLYFVRLQSGTITSVGPDGKPLHEDAGTLEVAPALKDIPSTHVFFASDPQGNVYISYSRRRAIEKRGSDGKVILTLNGFDRPEAIAVDDSGDLFVVDFNQIKILRAHMPSLSPSPKAAGTAASPKPAMKG